MDGKEDIQKIAPFGDSIPYHNLYIYYSEAQNEYVNHRMFYGTSGARAIDRTAGRRVRFHDFGMETYPIVCGAFLTDP